MAPTETGVILLAGLIIFSGHLVKGVSGFGSALFAVPLLMLILDVKFITPVFLIFDFLSGAILVAFNWRSIHRRLLLLLLCGLLAGTAIGTWALLSFGHDALKRVLGLLVIGWASYALLRGLPPAAGDRDRLDQEHGARHQEDEGHDLFEQRLVDGPLQPGAGERAG